MLKKILDKYKYGNAISKDKYYVEAKIASAEEKAKAPSRTAIINFLLSQTTSENYLEIGVRNPENNFNKILSKNKYSVDPGVEFENNPVDFKMTSNVFFSELKNNTLSKIKNNIKFDVIFIDGLHLAHQVDLDIENSLQYIKEDGFIVLHDCNPPTEFHQRENYDFKKSPAGILWNGTTWKAFYNSRCNTKLYTICFDTDWGVGVISLKKQIGFNNLDTLKNKYFEFHELMNNKKEYLNLQSFVKWKNKFLENDITQD